MWEDKDLWTGFMKCTKMKQFQPDVFNVVLQLPVKQVLCRATASPPPARRPCLVRGSHHRCRAPLSCLQLQDLITTEKGVKEKVVGFLSSTEQAKRPHVPRATLAVLGL